MSNMEPIFIAHLVELRKRLIFAVVGFMIIFIALFPFANYWYHLLASPLARFLPANTQLIATDVISPFFVPLRLTAILAIIISLPNTIYHIWQFIAPGLYKQERRIIISVITSSFCLFIIGIAFCYFLVLPAVFHFVGAFKSSQITMMTDIDKYLSFVLSLFMIFGVAFETPVIVFLMIKFGILSIAKAKKIRPYIFVGSFILAAILTPPDVLSQTMLAIPLYALYELGVITARLFIKPNNYNCSKD